MSWWKRSPAAAVAGVDLARGERMLGWALTDGGATAAATDLGLRLPPGHGLLRWEEVDRASWLEPELLVVGDDGVRAAVRLEHGERFAGIVRARVEASIVLTRRLRLTTDGRGVQVVVRRSRGGMLTDLLRYDPGLDPHDPALRLPAEAFRAQVLSELGLPA